MRNIFISLVFIALCVNSFAVEKSKYDLIDPSNLQKANGQLSINSYGSHILRTDISEVTMITGGYFTIGTSNGTLQDSPLDDNCGITFGHPYAMTSYPILALDGTWQKLDDFCQDMLAKGPQIDGDTLKVEFTNSSQISTLFTITVLDRGEKLEFQLKLKNFDENSHNLGMGLVIDPALGQWDDGSIYLDDGVVEESKNLSKPEIPLSLEIWERGVIELESGPLAPKGMGMTIDFGDQKPDQIVFANWVDIYDDPKPNFEPGELNTLYDATVKMSWPEMMVEPGGEVSFKFCLNLNQPDFSSDIFMRWDMPAFLSMDTNILFPLNYESTLQISNTSGNLLQNLSINMEPPYELSGQINATGISMSTNQNEYLPIKLNAKEIYEDKIVPVQISCVDNHGTVIDEFVRHVFIPATPVSDVGLFVSIDSMISSGYPEINVIFGAEVEETGQRVLDLRQENVFIYENDVKIKDFSLTKYSGGGSILADVVFVLDVSGSMGDEIDQVRTYLGEFGDSLQARGYDFKIGVVTFSTTVDHVWEFTDDIEQIRQNLASISLWGGIEDSPAALYRASELNFRAGSRRTIIWITDEPYPEHSYTKEQIVNRMLSMDITVHGVGLTNLQTEWFNPIVLPTSGNFYNITGNFRDILLDVARLEAQDKYQITYTSPVEGTTLRQVLLKVHYAGLGGSAEFNYSPPTQVLLHRRLSCFPNPFNPEIKINISELDGLQGEVAIYNLLGERIRQYSLTNESYRQIIWNAHDESGRPASTGFYLVQLSLLDSRGRAFRETQKILYLK